MTHNPDIEPILDSWLAEGRDILPDRSVEAVLRTVDRTSQRRAWGLPWREHDMNGSSRLATLAGAAIIVVLVVGGLVYLDGSQEPSVGGGGGPASTPTPTPSAASAPTPNRTPTADELLDTALWTPFTSSRYGYTIAHPADWSVSPGTSDWDIATDAEAWKSDAPDIFCSSEQGEGVVCVSAWSSAVAPGTTVDAWIETYCAAQGYPCPMFKDQAVPVATGDQHPGVGVFVPTMDTLAFFLDRETMYVVAAWRGEDDPSVRRYGGARALLEAFISTMVFEAPAVSPSPAP